MGRAGVSAAVSLAVLVSLGTGLAAGVWLTRPETPAALQDAEALTLAPVSARSYDDVRTVTLVVSSQEESTLASTKSGRVSAVSCAIGESIASGDSVLSIDGAGLLSLATSVPLWRDLTLGASGDDVTALNAELRRLGHDAPDSNRVTWATVNAFSAAARAAGAQIPQDATIAADGVLWLPGQSVTVADCSVRLGDQIAAGDELVALQVTRQARVTALPGDAVEGARAVIIDDELIAVDESGTVEQAALAALLGSPSYASSSPDEAGNRQFTVRWVLAEPAKVLVVPPAAIVGAGTASVCVVAEGGETSHVEIVGSELGLTFVIPTDGAPLPEQVLASPDPSTQCS